MVIMINDENELLLIQHWFDLQTLFELILLSLQIITEINMEEFLNEF